MKTRLFSAVLFLSVLCLMAIGSPVEARSRTRVSFNVNSMVAPGPGVYAVDHYRPYYSQNVYVAPAYPAYPVVYQAPGPYCQPVPVAYPAPYYYHAPVMVAPVRPVVSSGVSFSWHSRR